MSRRNIPGRHLALASLFLVSTAAAHDVSAWPSPLSFLVTPADRLKAAPAAVLTRSPAGRALHLVTSARTPLNVVARTYAVPLSAVRKLHSERGVLDLTVQLPTTSPRVPAFRPDSIRTYHIKSGDTLAGVAARFGLPVVDLLGVNLTRRSLDRLHVGETLNVPLRERGLLVTIKPGQTALNVIAGYGADLVATARANGRLPTTLRVGDQLLLPGVRAVGFQQQLIAQREAERRARAAQEQQLRYERFLAWKGEREKQKLVAKYEAQAQYERYLAWKTSPQRQAQIEAYERQAQFEAAQAALATQRREAAQRAAVVAAATPKVSAAQTGGGVISWPMTSYRITSRFGERDISFHQAVFHGGIDLAAPYGTPVHAATDGQVTESGYGDFGLNVYTTSGNSTVIYGHMSRTAVVPGQSVERGQVLGYVGCTGICTGPHLHFEVRIGGQQVDPLSMLP